MWITAGEICPAFLRIISWKHPLGKIVQPLLGFSVTFLVLFNLLHWQNSIDPLITLSIAAGLGLVVAIAILFSKTARCVSTLSIPQLTTQQGRLILLSIISGLLLGGPVLNITNNTNEVSKIISCVANISLQHGIDLKKAYQSAYDDITEAVKSNAEAWRQLSRGISDIVDPISNGLETTKQEIEKIKNAASDAANQCRSDIENAGSKCKQLIQPEKCGPFAFLCKGAGAVLNPVCDGVSEIGNICSPVSVISTAIKNLASNAVDSLSSFKDLFKFKATYSDSLNTSGNSSVDVEKIQAEIKSKFEEGFRNIKFVTNIIQYILISTILLIPLKAWMYLRNHVKRTGIITSQNAQRNELMMQIAIILVHFLLSVAIFSFDFLLYFIQHVVEENGQVSFEGSGKLGVSLDIQVGTAFQTIVDNFIRSFNVDRTHVFTTSTSSCLPNPTKPSFTIIIPIMIVYFIALALTVLGNRLLKTRTKIIQHFYPSKIAAQIGMH